MSRILIVAASLAILGPQALALQPDLRFTPIDLGGEFVVVSPGIQPAGGSIQLAIVPFQNVGSAPSGPFRIAIVLSADDIPDGLDRELHSIAHSGVAPGALQAGQILTIPVPADVVPGTYSVGVILDSQNQIEEADESNNTRAGRPRLKVVAPVQADLVAAPPVLTRFSVGSSDQPLAEGTVRVAVAPEGKFFLRRTTIHNQGSQAAGAFAVGYYISVDPTITKSDTRLRTVRVPSLDPLSSHDIAEQAFVVPTAVRPAGATHSGDYYFGVLVDVDNEVGELALQKEANNGSFVVPLKVMDAARDTIPVWRVQVILRTGTVTNAATNDGVFVGMSKREPYWADRMFGAELDLDGTWLDYAHDDFENGDVHSYDIRLTDVKRLGDLNRILIAKQGTDGWCIASLELRVNGRRMYTRDFPGDCDYLDGDKREIQIGYGELRSHPDWPRSNVSILGIPSGFSRHDIGAIVQTEVGHFTYGTNTSWHTIDGVRIAVTRRSSKAVAIQLGVKTILNNKPDVEVRIDMDLVFESRCDQTSPVVSVSVDNVVTDSDTGIPLLPLPDPLFVLLRTIDVKISRKIQAALSSSLEDVGASFTLPGTSRPVFEISSLGDVTFSKFVSCAADAPTAV